MELEEVLRYKSTWYLRTSAFVVDMGTQSTLAPFNSLPQASGLGVRPRSEGLKAQQGLS